jgi:hypothetical protein
MVMGFEEMKKFLEGRTDLFVMAITADDSGNLNTWLSSGIEAFLLD